MVPQVLLVYKVLRVVLAILAVLLVPLVYKDRPVPTEPLGHEEPLVLQD